MSNNSLYLKIPSKNSFQKRKNSSRKTAIITLTNNPKNRLSLNQLKLNINPFNFELLTQPLNPNTTKNRSKTDRKHSNSFCNAETSQLRFKIQLQKKKRQQKSLKSLLLNNQHVFKQRKNIKSEQSILKRNPLKSSLQQKINQQDQINIQTIKQIYKSSEDQKNMLQSTNFSIRPTSCQNLCEEKQFKKFSFGHAHINQKNKINNTSFRPKSAKNSSLGYQQKQNQYQGQIDIKLSLKSMTKSESAEACYQLPEYKIKTYRQITNFILVQSKKESVKIKNQKKTIFTPKSFKQNRLLLKFDKRLLLGANQLNDPCLKIEKINVTSYRIKTEPTV